MKYKIEQEYMKTCEKNITKTSIESNHRKSQKQAKYQQHQQHAACSSILCSLPCTAHSPNVIRMTKVSNIVTTYTTLGIELLLLQFLATGLDCLRDVLLSYCVWIETLHYRNVLEWIPLQHSLLNLLSDNRTTAR